MGTDFTRLSLNEALSRDPHFLNTVERVTGHRTMVTDLFTDSHLYEPGPPPLVDSGINGGPIVAEVRPTNFRSNVGVWQLSLSHTEVQQLANGARAASILSVAINPVVAVIVDAIAEIIVTVDAIGLNNGVNVVGVFQTQFVTVTPAFVSPFDILDRIVRELQTATGLPGGVVGAGIGAGIALLAVGPAGVVLGGLAGWLGDALFSGGPNPGDVHANRGAVGPWEKFLLVSLTPSNVAMGSWRGYFCAENGGGGPVHANRAQIGPWETATLVRNPSGTVSLRSQNGNYLCAENGGGSVCNWNRTAIGEWEQFWMEFQPDGLFALKTLSGGNYVSVQ